ncbi:MAG TPA: response regulator transcription factor [Geminicoccaceae bacterium]|nr:response regulator transcription factor [Geminicoccaceae bacterium]
MITQTINMSAKRVVIVDDHTILRNSLAALLGSEADLEVVGQTGDGKEAVRQIGTWKPDLVLVDLSMPGMSGMDVIGEIRKRLPAVRIVVLTVHDQEDYVRASLAAGANGYVLKTAPQEELLAAVRDVLRGHTHLSPAVQDKVLAGYLDRPGRGSRKSPWNQVTHRERQILKLVAEGRTNREVAEYLCLSVKTVETHRSSLMRKLNLHKVQALTAFAIENGVVEMRHCSSGRS